MDGVVAEWFLHPDGSGTEAEAEMRAGIARSRLGWPQMLHRHAAGEACNERCESIDPTQVDAP